MKLKLLLTCLGLVFIAGVGHAQLCAVGPIDPANGFPSFYEDCNGLRLALCLCQNGLCLTEEPDPTQPISFPDNFGPEVFWWTAEASMPTNNGGNALLVLAIEAAFANEDPIPGDQISFARVRVRVDNLVAGANYTITYPYGVLVLRAQNAGARGINFTDDVGIVPGDFTGALNGAIGPFLVWDGTAPAAPAGHIGDPAVEHTVTGSPFGTNFFRIEGPNVGGPGVNMIETDLFSVMGKIFGGAPAAGDFILMSFKGNPNPPTVLPDVGAIGVQDIVAFDPVAGTFAMFFDGSDVGLAGAGIDGFCMTPAGELLLSFTQPLNIPGLAGGPAGTLVDDSDIVRFTPASFGENTAGAFTFHFDGSDVGLDENREDIDAIALADNGDLLISISGHTVRGALPGLGNRRAFDEDLYRFTATVLGAVTVGTFSVFFDGSDVGLLGAAHDVDAAHLDPAGIHLSTLGDFTVGGGGGDEDILQFVPTTLGPNTTGAFNLFQDLSAAGVPADRDVSGLSMFSGVIGPVN